MNGDSNLAVFCDFENIALGVRDAKLKKIDIRPIVERLLLKGSIVAKKAYCDWDRYKEHKPPMHEAAFELIEIPHTRLSGKNSADIRMVVDALDLCYTKEHIDTFVIVSGDSDFSPLVSKLRENAKSVIGVGVKSSTSDLLMNNCDEFIFYDDLVAERQPARRRSRSRARGRGAAPADDSGSGASSSGAKSAERRSRRIQSRHRFSAMRYNHDENFDWPLNPLMLRNARRKVSWQTSRASSSRPRTRKASAKMDRSQRTTSWLKLSGSPAVASATSSSSVLCMPIAAARVVFIVARSS